MSRTNIDCVCFSVLLYIVDVMIVLAALRGEINITTHLHV